MRSVQDEIIVVNNKVMTTEKTLESFPYPTYRRVAYGKVVLPDGRELERRVVVFSKEDLALAQFPLHGELPFVEWNAGTYVFP